MYEASLSFDPWRNDSLEETRILRLNVILVVSVEMEHCTHTKVSPVLLLSYAGGKKSECKLYRLQKNVLKITQCCYFKNFSNACGADKGQGNQKCWWWCLQAVKSQWGIMDYLEGLWCWTKNKKRERKVKDSEPMFLDLPMLNLLRIISQWLDCLGACQSQIREQ